MPPQLQEAKCGVFPASKSHVLLSLIKVLPDSDLESSKASTEISPGLDPLLHLLMWLSLHSIQCKRVPVTLLKSDEAATFFAKFSTGQVAYQKPIAPTDLAP